MALPKQSSPKYKCVLPSDGREVEYRPFLVKEQKVLMMAQEQENDAAMFNAVKDLIESVTFGKVKPDSLPIIDMEYLFLKIRTKSIGETANIQVTCNNKDCEGGQGTTVINLDDVEVVGEEPENKIMISDELGVELRYPRISDVGATPVETDSVESQAVQSLELVKSCMVNIYDAEEVYPIADASTNEINEFMDSLSMSQLEMITSYFEGLPSLKKEVSADCEKCGKEIRTTVSGLNNFF